jgi:hypothetical protein
MFAPQAILYGEKGWPELALVWFSVVLLMAHAELWRLRLHPPDVGAKVGTASSPSPFSSSLLFAHQYALGPGPPWHLSPQPSAREGGLETQ